LGADELTQKSSGVECKELVESRGLVSNVKRDRSEEGSEQGVLANLSRAV